MNLINQKVEDWTPKSWTLKDVKKHIEKCGRICYKSEDKITEDSYEKFYDMISNSGHTSVLEHGTIYAKIPCDIYNEYNEHNFNWFDDPYKFENYNHDEYVVYVSSSLQCALAHHMLDFLSDYICEPEFQWDGMFWRKHVPRLTFKVTCPISVSRELNRHEAALTVSEQSTRYCNYTKDKFNNEITFVIPKWTELQPGNYSYWDGDWWDFSEMKILKYGNNDEIDHFLFNLSAVERDYKFLINSGFKAQEARELLPLCTATEVVYTGWLSGHWLKWDWEHVLSLRSPKFGAQGVHPMAAEIGDMIYDLCCNYECWSKGKRTSD